jgi:hypothetical protein
MGHYKTPEQKIWSAIKSRCFCKGDTGYPWYGARGITVCDRWRDSYDNFMADMGPRPTPKHSIDRIDSNGHYEPSNCRWATKLEQANNTRANRVIVAFDRAQTLTQWSRETGIKVGTIWRRLKFGMVPEQAVSAGVMLQGEANKGAKLKDQDVHAIRADGRSARVIAKDYGVSRSTITRVKRGEGWSHVS